jgi:hypothetical protein
MATAGIAGYAILTELGPFLTRWVRKSKNSKRRLGRVDLAEGFYHKKRGRDKESAPIIHYIGPKGRFSSRGRLPRLQDLTRIQVLPLIQGRSVAIVGRQRPEVGAPDAWLPKPNSITGLADPTRSVTGELNVPRVHVAAASWSFEEAALAILRVGAPNRKKSAEVCQLLLAGIQHDLLFKQRIKNERKKGRPSFRLYDLLAGISVRYGQDKYLTELLEMIESSEHRLLFQTRVEKWQDVTASWRQRWRNRREPVRWNGSPGAVVF